MIAKCIAIAAGGAVLIATFTTRADIYQTFNFSTNTTFSGSATSTFIPLGYFSASFSPYSGNPAYLTGFEIDWTLNFSASGVATPGNFGGFGGGPGGAYSVNGNGYGGNEGSLTSDSVTAGGVIPVVNCPVDGTNTFLVADAGEKYNPAILADVLGANPVDVNWGTDLTIGYGDVLSGQFSVTGSVTLIYNAVPEPSTLALAGFGVSAVCWLRRRKS